MNPWTTIATKAAIWLAVEILLTVTGLDNLADYSEFLFGRDCGLDRPIATVVSTSHCQ